MKNKLFLSIIILIVSIFYSCEETTQPIDSNELRLVLKADKTSGTVPLTVNFTAEIKGDTTGLVGLVPDYFFYPGGGRTIIRYALPDTLQRIKTWSNQVTYNVPGKVKAILLYQGIKNNTPFDLWSDTLVVTVQ
jgi:hypothetical protein